MSLLNFLYYLWGIETLAIYYLSKFISQLFILPMRNWNRNIIPLMLQGRDPLFILPMRNWNIETTFLIPIDKLLFLYYLWGIETIEYSSCFASSAFIFLYYLWGIETPQRCLMCFSNRTFYITYEELKLIGSACIFHNCGSFYITYEELKPKKNTASRQSFPTFYITYEELKPDRGFRLCIVS